MIENSKTQISQLFRGQPVQRVHVMVKDELAFDGVDNLEPGSAEWEGARNRIRLMVILKQIAKREGVEVDEMDVDNRIAEKAKEFGTSKKALQMELDKGIGMQRLRDMLLAESALEYLMELNEHNK